MFGIADFCSLGNNKCVILGLSRDALYWKMKMHIDLVIQGVAAGMATCDPAQGVQAQGTLGSEATCATTSSESLPRQSEPSRQMAAMPQPTSRRQRKK